MTHIGKMWLELLIIGCFIVPNFHIWHKQLRSSCGNYLSFEIAWQYLHVVIKKITNIFRLLPVYRHSVLLVLHNIKTENWKVEIEIKFKTIYWVFLSYFHNNNSKLYKKINIFICCIRFNTRFKHFNVYTSEVDLQAVS